MQRRCRADRLIERAYRATGVELDTAGQPFGPGLVYGTRDLRTDLLRLCRFARARRVGSAHAVATEAPSEFRP